MGQFGYYKAPTSFGLFPPVIKKLLIINIAVYFIQSMLGGIILGDASLSQIFQKYFALQPTGERYYEDFSVIYWAWQLITYQFMHGGLWHLLFNMFALWMFGQELEQLWGSRRFLTYYLLAGIGAGLTQILIQSGPTVGASGSVYGLLLAFGMTFPDRKIMMFPLFIPISAKYFVMIFAGIELLQGLGSNDGVAHFAHLGGAATGFLLIKFGDQLGIYEMMNKLWSKFLPENTGGESNSSKQSNDYSSSFYQKKSDVGAKIHQMWNAPKDSPPPPKPKPTSSSKSKSFVINGEEVNQSIIDEILDKISASGYQNLTDREKKILNELSKRI
jgi:rhomboid family protein